MKLLVSDYDGTIKTFDKNPNLIESYIFKNNIKEINAFVNNDNKFIIATGRNTTSIQKEINKYKILYNYLISYNGRVIVDKDNNILNAEYIDNDFICELDNLYMKDLTLYNEYKETNYENKLIYIYVTLGSRKNINDYINYLKDKYPNLEISYNILFNTLIVRRKYNKLMAINELLGLNIIDINREDIITIGDDKNDKEMIKYYNGYRMLISNPKLLFTTNNVATSVHKLIKKIQ